MNLRTSAIARAGRIGIALGSLFLSSAVMPDEAGKEYTVTMSQMRYGTIPGNLKVGDAITWVNKDSVLHTVTARDRSFDIRIPPKHKARMILKKSGTFAFYCTIHPAMRGTLEVAK